MSLKRLWDTENKKIVWAIPTWDPHTKLQVWTNDDGSKLYVYTWSAFRELSLASATVSEYGPVWKSVEDEMVGYYLTNEPTELYNWDSGDEAAYRFLNWTTVLQSWTVDEGETPEYTGDTPTKAATAQYTYTFSGWKPTVWPIYKKTDFKAQFTSTVNEYDITIASNDADYGTVDVAFVEWQPYGTAISAEGNVLTIWEGTSAVEVTATAEEWCVFSSWGELPATVTEDLTITATFIDPEEIIYNDLDSLDADALLAKITEEKASDGEWTQTINGREYAFEVVADWDFDNEANAILNDFYWYNWTAQVHVEVDQELQENTLVIWDITKEAVTPAEE